MLAIQMIALALPLAAQDPLSSYIDPASLAKLRAGETIKVRLNDGAAPSLAPDVSSRQGISDQLAKAHPAVAVETLRIIPDAVEATNGEQDRLRLFNTFHSVSTMKGITYWSASRNQRRTLFSESYAIRSPQQTGRIPDPVFDAIPAEDVMYTFQEDLTFGKNTYRESFAAHPDHLAVKLENLSAISYMFVILIQPECFVSHVVMIPAGKDILFYGLSYISTGMPLGDRGKREDSLLNRLVAMSDWLAARMGAPTAR